MICRSGIFIAFQRTCKGLSYRIGRRQNEAQENFLHGRRSQTGVKLMIWWSLRSCVYNSQKGCWEGREGVRLYRVEGNVADWGEVHTYDKHEFIKATLMRRIFLCKHWLAIFKEFVKTILILNCCSSRNGALNKLDLMLRTCLNRPHYLRPVSQGVARRRGIELKRDWSGPFFGGL